MVAGRGDVVVGIPASVTQSGSETTDSSAKGQESGFDECGLVKPEEVAEAIGVKASPSATTRAPKSVGSQDKVDSPLETARRNLGHLTDDQVQSQTPVLTLFVFAQLPEANATSEITSVAPSRTDWRLMTCTLGNRV
jgi:hypothetical protein